MGLLYILGSLFATVTTHSSPEFWKNNKHTSTSETMDGWSVDVNKLGDEASCWTSLKQKKKKHTGRKATETIPPFQPGRVSYIIAITTIVKPSNM